MLDATREGYQVVRRLGEGGEGGVWLCRHLALGSSHALKVLEVDGPDARSRFLAEGRLQASVHHPNVVSVTDVIELGGRPALVMEFVDGPTLEQWMVTSRSLRECLDVYRGLVAGVDALHSAGIAHGDLKPSNVLMARVGPQWVPRITDFGLARPLGDDERPEGLLGTPEYLAPEQLAGAGPSGPADWWSLGVVLCELALRRRPFEGDPILLALKTRSGPELPDHVPGVPDGVLRAVRALLHPDPAERAGSASAVLGLLEGSTTPTPFTLPSLEGVSLEEALRARGAARPGPPSLPPTRLRPDATPAPSTGLPVLVAGLGVALGVLGFAGLLAVLAVGAPPAAVGVVLPPPPAPAPAAAVPDGVEAPAVAPLPASPSPPPVGPEVRRPPAPPTPKPAEPLPGRLLVEGDAEVTVTNARGAVVAPGPLPPGTYAWAAVFPNEGTAHGTLEITAGHTDTLRCSAFAQRCR